MNDDLASKTTIKARGRRLTIVLLVAAWAIYLGFVGPWLISDRSTVSVLVGVAAGLALCAVTYFRLARPATIKESNK
ncbi:hypothetical protein [Luteibacter sp. Sphag1AF]|uniref:hypothetical protein n=1 Tax=Luteibacter sp. Sphag1AF TaxID=2587031 RepID=UPI001C8505D4|nr:hypothetical protein [Luteibacter sp. Sphag1AF]